MNDLNIHKFSYSLVITSLIGKEEVLVKGQKFNRLGYDIKSIFIESYIDIR